MTAPFAPRRKAAFDSLAAALIAALPSLAGRVVIDENVPGAEQTYPTVTIHPVRYQTMWDQAEEIYKSAADKLVVDVGHTYETVQLRVSAQSSRQRNALQDSILDLFANQALRPGVLVTEIVSLPALGVWRAAWFLDEADWSSAGAMDRIWEGTMVVAGQIPILVTREQVYRIDRLNLGFTERTVDSMSDPSVAVVEILADGGIQEAT